MIMSFKNKLFAKIPSKYISYKVKDKAKASEITKGYKAIRKNKLFDDDFYLKNRYRQQCLPFHEEQIGYSSYHQY